MNQLKGTLKSIIKTNNLRVIFLCLLAATIFWFFNALNNNYTTTLKYPLHFVYDHEKYVAVKPLPDFIQINISGLGWNLFRNSIGIKVTPLTIPLETPTEVRKIAGSALRGYISDQISEFNLNYVLTDTLYVAIDTKSEKTLKIKIDSANISLKEGHRITSSITYSPDSVRIFGPSSLLQLIPNTFPVLVPKNEINDNYTGEFVLKISNNKLVSSQPETIQVSFDVREFVKVEIQVPLERKNFPADKKRGLSTDYVNLSYLVDKEKENTIPIQDFEVAVDYQKIAPSDSTIVPQLLKTPAGTHDVAIDSTEIKILFND